MQACKRNIDVLFLQWSFWWPGGFSSVADFLFFSNKLFFFFYKERILDQMVCNDNHLARKKTLAEKELLKAKYKINIVEFTKDKYDIGTGTHIFD